MKKILLMIFVGFMLISCAYADNTDIIDSKAVENAVPDTALDLYGEADISAAKDVDGLGRQLMAGIKSEIQKYCDPAIKRCVALLLVSVICSVLQVFGDESNPLYMKICACCAISLICAGDMNSYIKLGSETLSALSEFSKALLPALCTAGIVCGTPVAAAAKYAASAMFLDILIIVATDIIMPAIYAYTAIIIASAAFDNKALSSLCNILKWFCVTLLTLLTFAFVIYISISSAISGSGDAVASKVAKTAISMSLPVVGGIISDAASAVVAGAELVRSTVGVFGLFVVLAICMSPFVVLGLNCLLLKASAAVVKSFDSSGISTLINDFGGALGMILALTGSAGIMTFISIISCIRAVNL